MSDASSKFPIKSASLALLLGFVIAALIVRLGIDGGSQKAKWQDLRVPAQLDGDFITALNYHSNSGRMITGFESGHAAQTERSGQATLVHGHNYRVNHIAVTDDGVLSATSASEAVIWNHETGQALATLSDVNGPMLWAEEGEALFVVRKGRVSIYDVVDRRFHSSEVRCGSSVTAIALDKLNGILAAGSNNGHLCLWKVITSDAFRGLDLITQTEGTDQPRNQVKTLEFSQQGDELLAVFSVGRVQRLSVPDLAIIQSKMPQLSSILDADFLNPVAGSVALAGRMPHWDGDEDYFVELFNLSTGQSDIVKAKTSTMNHLAWVPGSGQLIVGNVTKYLLLDVPPEFH